MYKVLSDSTLMGMKKKDIIALLRCAEHNCDVANERFEQQYQNVKDWQPVKHGHWNMDGECSVCKLPWNHLMTANAQDWGYFDPMPPYCPNCGAKMDL